MPIVDVMMNRQQFDRRDAEVEQMLDRRLRGQAGVGAAQLFRHFGMRLREALDVQFVDERLVPGRARRPIVAPGEGTVDHGGQRGELRRCRARRTTGRRCRIADLVAEQRIVPIQVAADRLGIRIEQDFVRLKRWPFAGSYGP